MRLLDRLTIIKEGIGIAIDAIRSNKVRAGLTIMGVAVGVFVVTAMAAAVHGIRASFPGAVDAFGATSFHVRRRGIQLGGCAGTDDTCPEPRNPALTLREAAAIRRLPSVQAVTVWWDEARPFRYRDRYLQNVGYDAMSAEWLETDAGDISPGRNFSALEEQAAARVVIINDSLQAQLFAEGDPIGKQIQIASQPFTVIGVYHTSAGFLKTMDGRGPDKPRGIIPFMTARRHLGLWDRGVSMMVKPRPDVDQAQVMDDVTALMRGMRGLRPAQPNNFALVTSERMMETFDKIFGAIFMVGLALSAVGLMVGGVGVVAIMMISVTERTREIGVRKALGATKGTILWQFLVEAATLTSLGAAAGLVLGTGAALLLNSLTPVPATVPLASVVAAVLASILTGVLFGLYPASKASRMDPVEALRYE